MPLRRGTLASRAKARLFYLVLGLWVVAIRAKRVLWPRPFRMVKVRRRCPGCGRRLRPGITKDAQPGVCRKCSPRRRV